MSEQKILQPGASSTMRGMTQEQMMEYYNMLTDAIGKYQVQEKQIWTDVATANNPSFTAEQKIIQADNKLNALRQERDMVMRLLSSEYGDKSRAKSAALKLKGSTDYITGLQGMLMKKANSDLAAVNQDLMTLRRMVGIENKRYSENIRSAAYVQYVATILSLLVLIAVAAVMRVVQTSTASYIAGAVLLLGVVVIVRTYILGLNDDPKIVNERTFFHMPSLYSTGEQAAPPLQQSNGGGQQQCPPVVATTPVLVPATVGSSTTL